MKIVETKVFKFEELTEEAQETAIENLYDINVDYEWWDIDYYVDKLAEMGFEGAEIRFSGFCSQGDGASFWATVDVEKILDCIIKNNRYEYVKDYYGLVKLLDKGMIELECTCDRVSHHYVHENTCVTRLKSDYCQENASEVFNQWFIETVSTLKLEIDDIRREACQDIYYSLRHEYDYLTSEEAIRETIICNDYDFTEDGKLF